VHENGEVIGVSTNQTTIKESSPVPSSKAHKTITLIVQLI